MNNILILTKNYLKSFVGSLIKNKNKPNFYIGLLICGLISVLITFSFTVNSISSTQIFIEQAKVIPNAEQMAMYTNCTMAILMLLFVTIMRSVIPSKSSDNDILLALPIKKIEITISKSLYNYLIDFVLFITILLPCYIVYVVMVPKASFFIVFRGLFLVMILPLLSNALATFIGLLSNKIASKMKHYSIFQTAFTIIAIALYLIANYLIQGYLTNGIDPNSTVLDIRNSNFIIKILLDFILDGKILWMLVFTALILCIYIGSLLFLNNRLGKIEKRYININKKRVYKKTNITSALIKKELRQYFNTPSYVLNTIISGVIYFGLCIAIFVIGEERALSFISLLPEVFQTNKDIIPIMILAILLSMFVITGSSISLEGKTFWIIVSNPIKPMTVFISKIFTNLILTGVVAIISFPFILTFIKIEYAWFYLLIPFIGSVTTSTFGLIINLKLPKMEWDKEEAVVKQSLSSMISLLIPPFMIFIPYVIYIVELYKYYNIHIFMLIDCLYLNLIFLMEMLWLNKKGPKALISALNS